MEKRAGSSQLTFEDVISSKDGKCTRRIVRYLKPCARNQAKTAIPAAPKITPRRKEAGPSKITFKRWDYSRIEWENLVDRLALDNAACWYEAGIVDAVLSSTYEIHWNDNLVLGLIDFWCPETNTFVFPWGEATITLEDAMILGGFPVTGELVSDTPATGETEITVRMDNQVEKTASYDEWLEYFRNWGNKEIEHVGFLASWLSKFVFPSVPVESAFNYIFPLAAKLSRRKKLALAPAVLATLYDNLTLLKSKVMNGSELCTIAKPLELLILWAYEHFPILSPFPNKLKPGEPRIACWHDLSIVLTVDDVKSGAEKAGKFEWRPYASELDNWRHLSYYKEREQLRSCSTFGDDEEMESYRLSLLPCELAGLGLDCRRQKYQPQRVAMQLGRDQDVPADFDSSPAAMDFLRDDTMAFFVPARSFSPGVSLRYSSWWKESVAAKRMIDDSSESIDVANKRRKLGGKYGGGAGDPIIII